MTPPGSSSRTPWPESAEAESSPSTAPTSPRNASFDRISETFERLRRIADPERSRALGELESQDAPLATEVRELLRFHDAAPDALDEGILRPADDRIGLYRLVRRLGEGGMGTVWLAEQEQPVRRTVAVKVIKAGMDTRAVVRRFETERQVLARMEHPGIARVLDAGATLDGRPYFAMEFVQGRPLLDWCDERNLPLRERVRLFVSVCRAVAHAHRKGVLHRDLKPSNILVTEVDGQPAPKVIDFGVAKALDDPNDGATLLTSPGAVIGTPDYMSPEQATAGGDIDTRTDIYALGVVLYELLTGTTPRRVSRTTSRRGAKLATLSGLLRGDQPPRPSSAVDHADPSTADAAARSRSTDARGLRRALRGDLDWIILRAIAPERERRYGTIDALADDLIRSLSFEPVEARPPSFSYLARRFAQRHAGALVAAGAVALALVGGLAVAIDGWRAAQLERDAAIDASERERATARSLADRLHESVVDQGRAAARGGDIRGARDLLWNALLERPGSATAHWALRECFLRHPIAASVPLLDTPPFAVDFLDDSRAVVALRNASPAIVDLDRAIVTEHLPGPSVAAVDLAISPDRRWLVVGDTEGDVHAWDLASRRALGIVASHGRGGDENRGAFLAPWMGDGRFISGGADGRLICFSLLDSSSEVLYDNAADRSAAGASDEGVTAAITRVASHPSGWWALGLSDGLVRAAKPGRSDVPPHHSLELGHHPGGIAALAFDGTGTRLASGCFGRAIMVHDLVAGERLDDRRPTLGTIRDLHFLGDGRLLIAGWWEVSSLDLESGALTCAVAEAAWRMQPSGSGDSLLIVTGSSGSLRLWGLRRGVDMAHGDGPAPTTDTARWKSPPSPIATRRLGERGDLGVAGCRGGEVLVRRSDGSEMARFSGYRSGSRNTIAMHEGRELVAWTDVAGGVRLRSIDGSIDKHLVADEEREILSLAFDPAGDRLAITARTGSNYIVHLSDGRVERLRSPSTAFVSLFTPDGSTLLAGTWRGTIEPFRGGALSSRSMRGHGRMVDSLVIDPGAPRWLVSGDAAGSLRIWDHVTERCLLSLDPFDPPSGIRAIELREHGDLIRVTAADGRVAWWRWSEVDRWIEANRAHEEAIMRAPTTTGPTTPAPAPLTRRQT